MLDEKFYRMLFAFVGFPIPFIQRALIDRKVGLTGFVFQNTKCLFSAGIMSFNRVLLDPIDLIRRKSKEREHRHSNGNAPCHEVTRSKRV
jgi:hypothetical protein